MNKRSFLFVFAVLCVSVLLVSWGRTGHRVVARIAENHLSPNARAAVRALLGDTALDEISSWADDVRNLPEYKQTEPWHYIDLPLGLSYEVFKKEVEGQPENVYKALLAEEAVLTHPGASRVQRVEALKFVVHFIGDMHQPMHVSRAEDKGGNTIQVNYEGKGTNLHSLWDTKLLEHQGLGYDQLAEKYDHVTPEQIRQWQSDPLIKWVWESYQISTRLYAEVDAMKSRSIDDSYFQAHIGIIQERIVQAGIRLAGVLNELFKNGPAAGDKISMAPGAAGASSDAQGALPVAKTIDIKDAAHHMDEYVTVCSPVFGSKELESMTLVNLGGAYPDQLLTLVLRGAAKDANKGLDGQTVCVTGKIVDYKGKPEIIVADPKMVVVSAKP